MGEPQFRVLRSRPLSSTINTRACCMTGSCSKPSTVRYDFPPPVGVSTLMCCPGSKFSRLHRSWHAHCTRRTPATWSDRTVAGTALVLRRPPAACLPRDLGLQLRDLVAQLAV